MIQGEAFRQVRRWAILLALSGAFIVFLEIAGLPAAFLLGPMIAAILLAVNDKKVEIPQTISLLAQGVIGCMIAQSIPLSILGELSRDWPIFVAGVVSVVVAACSLGWLLAKLQVLPGTTAIWGSFPGAASAMTIMSSSFGADMRLVAFMQYLRVVCVSATASLIARVWTGHSGSAPAAIDWFPPVAWTSFGATLVLIAACLLITNRFKVPGGIFLLPMIAAIALQNAGIMQLELPPWLLALSYILVGWAIGMRFSHDILMHAVRALPRVLGSIFALILICAVFAAGLVHFAGIDPLTAYLATSPGGADSVAIISASSDVDVPFVMAMQLARFLLILVAGPAMARLVVRWSGLRDATRAPVG
jgi:membrane AbrB-like protein